MRRREKEKSKVIYTLMKIIIQKYINIESIIVINRVYITFLLKLMVEFEMSISLSWITSNDAKRDLISMSEIYSVRDVSKIKFFQES